MTSCEVEGQMGPALVESRAHDLQLRCHPCQRLPASLPCPRLSEVRLGLPAKSLHRKGPRSSERDFSPTDNGMIIAPSQPQACSASLSLIETIIVQSGQALSCLTHLYLAQLSLR